MTVPNCPDHGELVLELARGRLDDQESVRAEQARVECDHCSLWWSRTFGDDSLSVLDAAVDEVFSSWAPPARRRRAWLAAAAAAVLAIGLGTTMVVWRDGEVSPAGARTASKSGDVVSVMDFENGIAERKTTVVDVGGDEPGEADAEAVIFTNDLESGDFSTWSSHS
jgi:hypothetical protein